MDGRNEGLLDDVRVLDLSIWRPGPYATQLLAGLGADVIKVEPPGGDPMRRYAGLFASLHTDKRSVVLDLKDEADRDRALALAAGADVFIEGYRPGVAERLGVGYDAVRDVNPTIVYCSVSGMGQAGPLAMIPGHDLNYGAWAGVLAPDGGAPVVPAIPVADLSGGMAAAFTICAALVRRDRTGEGERIDVAMADVLATWTGTVAPVAEGTDPTVRGVPGYGTFATADGRWVALGVVSEDHFWSSLSGVLGLDDAADLGFEDRVARLDELQARIATAIEMRERDALVDALLAADVPAAPVLDRTEMTEQAHFRERGVVTSRAWADPADGFPVRLEHHPAGTREPPPELGEHQDATFRPRPR
jgi:crotonobetainyl-CoA:carnitine CoA-transferase CaiB-like acyl-CoA transferase